MPRFIALLLICLTLGAPARADQILVFAAASLQGTLDEVLTGWDGAPVVISYAGSATLARQIAAGAPADLFLSAHGDWMEYLTGEGLVAETRDLLGNRLVLAGPEGSGALGGWPEGLAALPEDTRIATGLTQAVPAGLYAWQALTASGLAEEMAPRLVQTENVRLALALAARGEVAAAMVYATDALAEPGVTVLAEIPEGLHDPIRYPIARLSDAPHAEAVAFYAFLTGPEALARFTDHGFLPLNAEPEE